MKRVRHWLRPLALIAAAAMISMSSTDVAAQERHVRAFEADENLPTELAQIEKNNTDRTGDAPRSFFKKRGICPAQLEPAIDNILDRSTFTSGRWGVLIESLDGETIFYNRNGEGYFIPASNIKLFTTAAALQLHPSEQRIRSLPLKDWVMVINKRSDNGYADTLLRDLGGSKIAKQALTSFGIDPNRYRLIDGSGLSRSNMVTPVDVVKILRIMNSDKEGALFRASLPVAGVSGTLKNRMRATPAQGIVQAKTGTLRGVKALSGYMDHPEYGTIVFSIIVNQLGQSNSVLTTTIDRIVLLLTQLQSCNE